VLMTPVMPGWGQLYNASGWRATLAFGAEMYFWSNMISRERQAARVGDYLNQLPQGEARDFLDDVRREYYEQMRDYAWWSGGVLLIIALDAYVGARLYGFEEDPLPVPDDWDEHFPPADVPEPIGAGGPTMVVWQWGTRF